MKNVPAEAGKRPYAAILLNPRKLRNHRLKAE
ncbi:hypothetical protein HCH_06277 [Hahella chejuensis KCTC 2396]|uniref:Uncharacterized protein n=1 Tax=Hahella chejuensis (strain KCTC 2396) TaxID=349521 RepID=Q2S8V0_HAHCH|nr:hypothetical protein HCH_06277 [Hahella chejuensis KCTC 2396]